MIFNKPEPDSPPPSHWRCWQHAWVRACWRAQPWWQCTRELRAIYAERDRLRARGQPVVVDHLVPLQHPHVCGLHVPANLAVVPYAANARKSNRHWPGMWAEQQHLGLEVPEPEQKRLL